MNDADECIHNFGTDIRQTYNSRLIRKFEFEFQILASAEVCTVYYRQNIFNYQDTKRLISSIFKTLSLVRAIPVFYRKWCKGVTMPTNIFVV